jgi:hypothetical protein
MWCDVQLQLQSLVSGGGDFSITTAHFEYQMLHNYMSWWLTTAQRCCHPYLIFHVPPASGCLTNGTQRRPLKEKRNAAYGVGTQGTQRWPLTVKRKVIYAVGWSRAGQKNVKENTFDFWSAGWQLGGGGEGGEMAEKKKKKKTYPSWCKLVIRRRLNIDITQSISTLHRCRQIHNMAIAELWVLVFTQNSTPEPVRPQMLAGRRVRRRGGGRARGSRHASEGSQPGAAPTSQDARAPGGAQVGCTPLHLLAQGGSARQR